MVQLMAPLSPARRRELRAAAHHLNPVVSVAGKGLSASVVAEIERALSTHELVKVRIYGEDRAARASLMEAICQQVSAEPVQHIGNILVLWREKPAVASPAMETVKPRARAAKPAGPVAFARAARAKALAPASNTRQGARKGVSARASGHRPRGPQR